MMALAAAFSGAAACTTGVKEVSTTAPASVTLSDGGSRVLPASCTDGKKDNGESDVDCGGGMCAACTGNKTCGTGSDCISTICSANGTCTFVSSHDGVKNGSETGVDCGGASSNPRCPSGQGCASGSDCSALVCTDGTCAVPSPTDGVKNGGETGVDCGGADTTGSDKAPACPAGSGCTINADCTTNACAPTSHTCVPATAMDGFQDGSETDVDCGGSGGAAKCATGQMCKVATDCASAVCTGGTCIAPSPTDGVKNGAETDVDCGGSGGGAPVATGDAGADASAAAPMVTPDGAPACAAGKICLAHSDCASNGCDDTGHCALAPSCTATHGGLSCGSGESGDPAAVHESCCIALPVPTASGTFLLDKYPVTAGRMRQFIDRNNGNIRAYVQANRPDGWDPAWDSWVPDDYDDNASDSWGGVYSQMGAYNYNSLFGGGNEGCVMANEGARTYRFSDAIDATYFNDPQGYDASITDEKALNCTPWLMFYAFCAWDGGHLQTNAEFNAAWRGTDNRTYPWGASPDPAGWGTAFPDAVSAQATAFSPATGDPTITNWLQNYWMPAEMNGGDYSIYIAAPGRFPKNAGPYGHMDLGGIAMESTSTYTGSGAPSGISVTWSMSGSWQGHAVGYEGYVFPGTNKYIAQTARCAR